MKSCSFLNMAASSQWEFKYIQQSSQDQGHHILDDVIELHAVDVPQESPTSIAQPIITSSKAPVEIIDISADVTSSALNDTGLTAISESSHTTFRSTISRRSSHIASPQKRKLHDSILTVSSHSSGSSGGSQAVSTSYSSHAKRRKLADESSISFISQQSYPPNSQNEENEAISMHSQPRSQHTIPNQDR